MSGKESLPLLLLDDDDDEQEQQVEVERGGQPRPNRRDEPANYGFKAYVMVLMAMLWTGYTITVRYTRSVTPADERYFATTVVLLSETTKLSVAVFFLWHQSGYSPAKFGHLLNEEFFGKPIELLKMSVPSLCYALQNNLDFVSLSNLDAGVYQVTTQLKVVTTAVFMVVMLGRHYSARRWSAILGLFAGVAFVQLDAVKPKQETNKQNYFIGISAVLITCVTAGFAGVYFERMLKDNSKTPFWIRNLQMYSCGVVSAMLGCVVYEGEQIAFRGFFYGYSTTVVAIVGFLSIGGIYISLVMKHLDNLMKSFAAAASIISVVALSYYMFGSAIGLYFVFGTATVCASVLLYNSVAE